MVVRALGQQQPRHFRPVVHRVQDGHLERRVPARHLCVDVGVQVDEVADGAVVVLVYGVGQRGPISPWAQAVDLRSQPDQRLEFCAWLTLYNRRNQAIVQLRLR